MLLPCQWGSSHRLASVLDKTNLDQNCSNNYAQEEEIVKETLEYVIFFVSELSWVYLIEDLHEYKSVENYSIVLGFLSCQDLISTID